MALIAAYPVFDHGEDTVRGMHFAQNVFFEKTEVFFKPYTAEDISDYLDTDEAYDKAGAYAIQGWFSRYIDHIEGDYDNVVGLPVTSVCSSISRL